MESESPSVRHRGKKLSTNKLSALEKLKKARQGEKVEEEEEEEEELYDYIEEEYEEEDEFDSHAWPSKKNNKNHHDSSDNRKKASNAKRHWTKDKTTNEDDENIGSNNTDIRTAFFKAATNTNQSKLKSEKKLSESNHNSNAIASNDDDLANEIMMELQKKTKPKAAAPINRPSPKPTTIPFSVNQSVRNNVNLSLSPAHKRKASPSLNKEDKADGANQSKCKKLDLDAELVQQLIDSDSQPYEPQAAIKSIQIKSEPVEIDLESNKSISTSMAPLQNIKKEVDDSSQMTDEDREALENLELLSQLSLEATNNSALSKQLNLHSNSIKQEACTFDSPSINMSMNVTTSSSDDIDLQSHIKNQSNLNKFLFYWYDAYEDSLNLNGTIYLFGKTPILKQQNKLTEATQNNESNDNQLSFVSVCCIIKNIPKVAYVLPRKFKKTSVKQETGTSSDPVTMAQVKQEIDSMMEKFKITSYKTRVVKKYFAFDKRPNTKLSTLDEDIPYESEYLEIEYNIPQNSVNHHANQSHQLPSDLQGECFSCIIGSQTSYLEHFLIDLKIKGPCWLMVNNAKTSGSGSVGSMLSWCKLEYLVDNYRSVSLYHDGVMLDHQNTKLPPTPPLNIMSLLIKTMLNTKNQEHEIVFACGLISNKFFLEKATNSQTAKNQQPVQLFDSYFCAVTKPSGGLLPYDFEKSVKNMQQKLRVEIHPSERALLAYLLCKVQSLDIDIIVGHDLFGFNIDILLNRCVVNKVPHWSRMGRLKRTMMPSMPHNKSHNNNYSSTTNNIITQQRIQTVCAGRLLCDIMLSSKELLTKCKSFDLHDLVNHILHKKDSSSNNSLVHRDYEEEKNVANYYSNSNLLLKFIQLAMVDNTYIMRICSDLQCLQLAYQITCIAGNILSRTLVGGRSERNEYLLLHAFNDKDFILPDKYSYNARKNLTVAGNKKQSANKSIVKKENSISNSTQMDIDDDEDRLLSTMEIKEESLINHTEDEDSKIKMKPVNTHSGNSNGYTGGLVLEPKVGFYDKFILLLDFNSLYPSIIQEYNICFTTISRPQNELLERDIDEYLDTCIKLPGPDEKPGILPLEIRKLVDSRRQVKQLMQDKNLSPDLKMQYDIRQKALKLTANSVYGCLGFENSRFYCKPLAALITKNGRSLLMKTKELVENKKIEVIYGDTDSIMINSNLTDYDQVIKLGNMLKAEVNKLYKHLEIDIDGVFKSLLLLRKKKYAALTIVGRNPKDQSLQFQQEIKGLDVVRRDWCLLAKQIGEKVISEILSGQNCDLVLTNINKILNETAEKIKNNQFDLSLFEISKQLNRNPEDYNDANHQSHVLVALRHNKDVNNSKKYKSGNVVSYIICEDGSQNSAVQRAYSKSELVKTPDKLQLDKNYYLSQQIHPVVSRLCEPIDGMDAYHIAQALGLDPSGFKHKSNSSSSGQVNMAPAQLSKQQKKLESFMNELEKYKNCIPFKYTCPECKHESLWQSPFIKVKDSESTGVQIKNEPNTQQPIIKKEDSDEEIEIDGANINISKKQPTSYNSNFKCILDSCSNPACKVKPLSKLNYIKNNLTIQLNKFIKQYYQFWLVCEDPMCTYRTKRLSCKFFHGKPQCIECEKYAAELEYTHSELYFQMKFFKFIFDVEAYKNYYKDDANEILNLLRINKDLANGLNQIKDHVNRRLRQNQFGIVNLTDVFKFC